MPEDPAQTVLGEAHAERRTVWALEVGVLDHDRGVARAAHVVIGRRRWNGG
jgi:hypothetical protein